jgi:ATP-binding cassette subfamily B protein
VSPIARSLEALEALTGNIGELTGQIAAPITRAFRSDGRRTPISPWAPAPDRRRAPRGPRPSASDARRLWARAAPYFRPFRRRVAEIAALSMLVAFVGVLEPLVMKQIVDALGGAVQHAAARTAVFQAVGALVGLEILRAALAGRISVRTWDVRLGVDFQVRRDVVGALNGLPMSYHQDGAVGATLLKVNQHIPGFAGAASELLSAMSGLGYFVLAAIAMLRLDWRLTAAVLLVLPLPALIGVWAAKEQTERERKLADRWARLYSRFAEVMSGILTVKACGAERREQLIFLDGVDRGNAIVARGVRRDAVTGGVRSVAAGLARLVAIWIGTVLILRGEITLGTLMAFLAFVGGLVGPVQTLTSLYQTIRKTTVSFESILAILDADDSVRDRPTAVHAGRLRGHVRFDNVRFSFRPGTPTLQDVTFEIPAGQTVAMVGPSGGGKSTLAQLLQRIHAPEAGRITIDGQDVAELTLASLRTQIGVVPQEPFLFNDTVLSNLAYARPSASREEIEAAARAANAHAFIQALPLGYDTVVGERGGRLSGGQRQRIAIARALLQNPAILVLDEPTSALDPESERLVQEALARLTRSRTTLIIAHRLRTVASAHQIVVIEEGRVVEQGSHDELRAACGHYAALAARELEAPASARAVSSGCTTG